jgi:hypothetical protein
MQIVKVPNLLNHGSSGTVGLRSIHASNIIKSACVMFRSANR